MPCPRGFALKTPATAECRRGFFGGPHARAPRYGEWHAKALFRDEIRQGNFVSAETILDTILDRPDEFTSHLLFDLTNAYEELFRATEEGLATAAGHEDRQAPLKSYCKGLLLPGERKSIQPMAARLDPENIQPMRQSLHHLVAKAPWSDEVLLKQVRN
jgi:hypothetical protein